MTDYQIGDFARVEFIHRPAPGKKNWFRIFATVTDVDRYYIVLTDNHGTLYLVQKRDVKKFKKKAIKNQNEITS